MRLLLDEMYPRLIATELQARGHDVVSVRDYRSLGEELMAAGESHTGMVFTTPKRWPRSNPGALIAALNELLTATPEQPIDGELWL